MAKGEQISVEVQKLVIKADMWKVFFKYMSRVLIVGFIMLGIYFSVKELAGKTTMTQILMSVFGEIKSQVLAWGTAASGAAYGFYQKRLRKRDTERYTKRIEELEKRIDPKRKSSNLNRLGENKREDKND